jgi:hypothetical protein
LASPFGIAAAVLARVLGAFALGWGTARVLRHHDALHIGAAILFCVLALWLAVVAAAMLYVLVAEREVPDQRDEPTP